MAQDVPPRPEKPPNGPLTPTPSLIRPFMPARPLQRHLGGVTVQPIWGYCILVATSMNMTSDSEEKWKCKQETTVYGKD
ncbi:hypothetical protein E2C01_075866 [Portunus trituberculatus]|uniref:Uncharacterized protein n=1 Tax=Portunus trituberculatus TaxID=210409 RepID=A0A5B7IHG2_PORTR|nr:hypothetical protein [Portunus trituberculatus]